MAVRAGERIGFLLSPTKKEWIRDHPEVGIIKASANRTAVGITEVGGKTCSQLDRCNMSEYDARTSTFRSSKWNDI